MYFKEMKAKRGFTLVELSIVIVVIGLIVAGVIGGQALVKQANLRKVMTNYSNFEVAYNAFKLEYNAIPGDMYNANDYWPGCNSGASASHCNGNGNRRIDFTGGSFPNDRESVRAWQHLMLAGILNGDYSGVGVLGGIGHDITNSPYVKLNGKTGVFATWDLNYGFMRSFYGDIRVIADGNQGKPYHAIMTARDAYAIDVKIDDGKYGNQGFSGLNALNRVNNCSLGLDYNITNNTLD